MRDKSTSVVDIVIQALLALVIVLFFACFGDAYGSVRTAIHSAWVLIKDTVTGTHLYEQYWTVTPGQLWYSFRLIIVAFLFALIIGVFLAFARTRIRTRFIRRFTDAVASLLESMPEAMYVIIVVVIVLIFLNWGIVIPAFSASDPTWAETFVPAFALSLPGAFYLQRVLNLQLRDELDADYIRTARAKGATGKRIFYRHVVPNLSSGFLRQLPVVAALILSSAIFAEFFLEYPGALFIFTNFAAGWSYLTGIPLTAFSKPSGLPMFQHGLVFVIGAAMVLIWVFIRIIVHIIHRMRFAGEQVSVSPGSQVHRIRRPSLIIGILLLAIVIIIGADPHLITRAKPVSVTMQSAIEHILIPIQVTAQHPFGTDGLGRDLLLEAASSTFLTLIPVAIIAVITVAGSLVLATIAYTSEIKWLRVAIRYLGESIAGVPVLYVLFLALYTKNMGASAHQMLDFILWVAAAETGRGAYAFLKAMQGWNQFVFLEGATSLGRSRLSTLFSHLRSWLGFYTLEYGFTEFARVLTITTQLAAFHIYMSEKLGILPFDAPLKGIVATHQTWVSMIGDATAGMEYIAYPFILFAPVLFLVVTVVGANLVARGIRG